MGYEKEIIPQIYKVNLPTKTFKYPLINLNTNESRD